MAKLRLLKDGVEVRSYDLDSLDKTSLIIGRAEGCDIRIDDRSVGREHAVFSVHGSKISVHKKSKFGKMSINGVDSADSSLKSGDVISISDYKMELEGSMPIPVTRMAPKINTAEIKTHEPTSLEPITPPPILELSEVKPDLPFEVQLQDAKDQSPDIMHGFTTEISPEVPSEQPPEIPFTLNESSVVDDRKLEESLGTLATEHPMPGMLTSSDFLKPLGEVISQAPSGSKKLELGEVKLESTPLNKEVPGSFNLDLSATPRNETPPPPVPFEATMQSQVQSQIKTQNLELNTGGTQTNSDRTKLEDTSRMEAKLIFNHGDANVDSIPLDKPLVTIGKGSDCDVVLNDKSVSRKHSVIKRIGAKFLIVDQSSSNGTYVNGERISEHELFGEDIIQIGNVEFQFQAVDLNYLNNQNEFISVPDDTIAGKSQMMDASAYYKNASATSASGMGQPSFSRTPAYEMPAKKNESKSVFNKLPKPVRLLVLGIVALVIALAFFGEDPKPKKSQSQQTAGRESDSFEKLPPEKKQFVVNTYQLAMDLYKNQEFERALFEINKVLEILPQGYKDAKDLKVYAEKAIEIEKSKSDEKKRKEEQEKIALQVADLLTKLEKLVADKKEVEAKNLLSQIFELDPENATALRLKQELDELIQKSKRDEEERISQEEKKKLLEQLITEGRVLLNKGKYYEVMDHMVKAPDTGCTDSKLLKKAANLIVQAKYALREKVKPYLEAAKTAMRSEDYPKARDEFYKVLKIDYKNAEAKKGLAKIREILHKRSQLIYTQAVLAESVSDFEMARNLYQECLVQSMQDDIYYGRCHRKLVRFQILDKGGDQRAIASDPSKPSTAGQTGGSDPQMPQVDGGSK